MTPRTVAASALAARAEEGEIVQNVNDDSARASNHVGFRCVKPPGENR